MSEPRMVAVNEGGTENYIPESAVNQWREAVTGGYTYLSCVDYYRFEMWK